ncbi:MAG: amino acid deaminase/aldolase [Microbacteriaceae bacterium]|nr:amino acid deaminase/aldolase [Microbacteriaceae bacterium]
MEITRPESAPWRDPAGYWGSLQAATAHLDAPYGVISLAALAHNAYDLLDRAAGTPIRIASKSVRVRGVLDAVLALPGYAGVLGFTLAEALWLATDGPDGPAITDVVVAYPTADRTAIRALAASPELASRVTLMVDSLDQLDFIDAVVAPAQRATIRVCLELDASWVTPLFGHVGAYRSPLHTAGQARDVAAAITTRAGFTLVGMMGYEAQIAGVVNNPGGSRLRGVPVRWLQRRSASELADRRAAAVAAVRSIVDLEFVNAGGTGSLESSVAESAVTEVAAGSGLFGPHLFDNYLQFHPAPAAAFALAVVRKPSPATAGLMGGGWVASGPVGNDRLPKLEWPRGLSMVPREMAGEVQTPVRGAGAAALRVGDLVWLRHTKAGEPSEHLDEYSIVDGETVVATMPTYRGHGKLFL